VHVAFPVVWVEDEVYDGSFLLLHQARGRINLLQKPHTHPFVTEENPMSMTSVVGVNDLEHTETCVVVPQRVALIGSLHEDQGHVQRTRVSLGTERSLT
jgi:hypothetical protein